MSRWLLIAWVGCCAACSPARLVGPPPVPPPVLLPPPVVVVVEPFFENAAVQTEARTERYTTWTGRGAPQDITVTRQVEVKPQFARVDALQTEHRIVLQEMGRLRPDWKVISTGELQRLEGPVRLVRVIVEDAEIAGSNRPLKSMATAFGVLIWPLLLVNVTPVDEVWRIHGTLKVYDADAATLRARLLRYPTQPDFAVDTRGLGARTQPFALEVEYQEGLFGPEEKRWPLLVRGFSERLAVAVVALIEGIR